MIVAKEAIKNYITAQTSVEELADKLKVAPSTLYSVANGNPVSAQVISKLLGETGFDFEKGFEANDSHP